MLAARAERQEGSRSAEQLRLDEDAAIRDAVALQQEVGLRAITDGELRRGSWHMDFIYELGGVERSQDNLRSRFHNEQGTIEFTPTKAGRARQARARPHDLRRRLRVPLAGGDAGNTPKLTIPSPSMVHYRGGRAAIDAAVYPEMGAFWADLAAVYAEEIRRLADLGCSYLQLDDTSFAYLNDPARARGVRRARRER